MEKIDATKVNWDKEGNLEATARPFPASSCEAYSNCTPFEIFEKNFDNELIELLVTESTRYAHFKNLADPQITINNMKCFIIILIITGYNELPGKKYYWDMEHDMILGMIFLVIFWYLLRKIRKRNMQIKGASL
uniref:PiggyBac transposable element-derived protein 2-like n=1 Tax=Diabrotica virgifera virgifera TaxID=50390 RepID=A0A6P7FVU9_DIAVI